VPASLRFDGYSDPSERSIHIVGIRSSTREAVSAILRPFATD